MPFQFITALFRALRELLMLKGSDMNWGDFLHEYKEGGVALFSDGFMRRWAREPWQPNDDDRKAAAKLHIQITSRITTQRLGYLDGVEKTALDSVYALFQSTRDIADEFPSGRHFEALAWDVLNMQVRPFTAKWHRQSERGLLAALDATDEFRAQLLELQPILRRFDDCLVHLRDGHSAPRPTGELSDQQDAIRREMEGGVRWGIPIPYGGIEPNTVREINKSEERSIRARRIHYKLAPDKPHAIALALSGGGIRSATFSLGVLVALARRGVLPQVDYLSTVSGGGYLGSFLSAFLNSRDNKNIGLEADDLPFRREAGEAEALRHIRQHSKYLATGSLWQQVKMISAQVYGMVLNSIAVILVVMLAIVLEHWLRTLPRLQGLWGPVTEVSIGLVVLGGFVSLVMARLGNKWQRHADAVVALPCLLLLALVCWHELGNAHSWYDQTWSQRPPWSLWGRKTWLAIVGAVPLITSALSGVLGRLVLKRSGMILLILSVLAAPVFLFGLYLVLYQWSVSGRSSLPLVGLVPNINIALGFLVVGAAIYLSLIDINFTSPHRYYRQKLAEAYLIQPSSKEADPDRFEKAVSIRLSELNRDVVRAPYHLLNCALNVPSSQNPAMQGRLVDFFLLSQHFCGSPLTGYRPTADWEAANPNLDLGTAMAISGAAAAPQMGLATIRRLSFWLGILNIRLGYWLRKPESTSWVSGPPGLIYLLREMVGLMDERLPRLNVSDGGHIENLGVYELLRRRCKYIIAIDGEQDPKMTFHGLTTLQRLAAIDLGVRIYIDLDDLRLNIQGLSRSHFRFCRILYPTSRRDSQDLVGYLLYVKLSLTGNEGEFIRRYRLDQPIFPHHSTADQLFTETQFEAYRSLGEHVGDKLFIRSIVGDIGDSKSVNVEQWFTRLGTNLLEPLIRVERDT
jgi:patatin-like phospholipase